MTVGDLNRIMLRLLLVAVTITTLKVAFELSGMVKLTEPPRLAFLSGGAGKQVALAWCSGDLAAMFGTPPSPDALHAVAASLARDSMWFIPLYLWTLLCTAAITVHGEARVPTAARVGLIALIAGTVVADLLENRALAAALQQAQATGSFAAGSGSAPFAVAKWLCLGGAFVALGAVNALQYGRLRRASGLLLLVMGLATLAEQAVYLSVRAVAGCDGARPGGD